MSRCVFFLFVADTYFFFVLTKAISKWRMKQQTAYFDVSNRVSDIPDFSPVGRFAWEKRTMFLSIISVFMDQWSLNKESRRNINKCKFILKMHPSVSKEECSTTICFSDFIIWKRKMTMRFLRCAKESHSF